MRTGVLIPLVGILLASPLAAEDACSLLTAREIIRTQGGRLKEKKGTARSVGGFRISQCFYRVEPFAGSVSLEITRRGASTSSPRDPRERWEQMFHGGEELPKKEEKKEFPPSPVGGLGDEAFWISNPASGALYALKGNAYLRISVGGSDSEPVQVEKATRLARHALSRL